MSRALHPPKILRYTGETHGRTVSVVTRQFVCAWDLARDLYERGYTSARIMEDDREVGGVGRNHDTKRGERIWWGENLP